MSPLQMRSCITLVHTYVKIWTHESCSSAGPLYTHASAQPQRRAGAGRRTWRRRGFHPEPCRGAWADPPRAPWLCAPPGGPCKSPHKYSRSHSREHMSDLSLDDDCPCMYMLVITWFISSFLLQTFVTHGYVCSTHALRTCSMRRSHTRVPCCPGMPRARVWSQLPADTGHYPLNCSNERRSGPKTHMLFSRPTSSQGDVQPERATHQLVVHFLQC